MKLGVLLFSVLSLPGFSQTLIGTVEKIDKDQFQVRSRGALVTLRVDEKTSITKVGTFHDLAPLIAGDEVRVTYYGEGTLTAVNVSVKITLSGVITEGRSSCIMVLPDGAGRNSLVYVYLDHNTTVVTSRKELVAGRGVQVTGWDAGNQVIEAERIAIHEADQPSRSTPQRHTR